MLESILTLSLNPCCNGRYSQRRKPQSILICLNVLILVVMEDTLRGVHEMMHGQYE